MVPVGRGIGAHFIVENVFLLGILHVLIGIASGPVVLPVVAIATLHRIELFKGRHDVWRYGAKRAVGFVWDRRERLEFACFEG